MGTQQSSLYPLGGGMALTLDEMKDCREVGMEVTNEWNDTGGEQWERKGTRRSAGGKLYIWDEIQDQWVMNEWKDGYGNWEGAWVKKSMNVSMWKDVARTYVKYKEDWVKLHVAMEKW